MRLTIIFLFLIASFVLSCSKQEEQEKEIDPDLLAGEQIVIKNCKVCHAQGINGAPVIGNSKMWSERKTQGIETLTKHAIEGYGLMPAKGGATELSDTQIKQAIKFMLSQVK